MKSLTLRAAMAAALVGCGVLALPAQSLAQTATAVSAKGKSGRVDAVNVELRAKVVEIDRAARTVLLQGPKGRQVEVHAGEEVRNFDQIKVGDVLVVQYVVAVAMSLEKTKGGIREAIVTEAAGRAAQGEKPGMGVGRRIEAVGIVEKIDKKKREVTLRGAKRTVVLAAPEDARLDKLKKGDEVRVVFTEALIVDMQPAPKKAPKKQSQQK